MSFVARPQHEGSGAPSEVLGTVAHELRQPLSNIESLAYYLSLVLPREDEKVQGSLTRIRQLVEQSNWILGNGLRLAGSPHIAPRPMRLEGMITQVVSAIGIDAAQVRIEFAEGLPLVALDPGHGPAMIETLLRLLLSPASPADPVTVRVAAAEGGVRMEFEGAPQRAPATLGAGAALAIECARRIAVAHGGRLWQEAGGAGGIRIVVMLP